MRKGWCVYLLSNLSGMLYVGLTDQLLRRLEQHRNGTFDGFTKKYGITRLMYFEVYTDSKFAEFREKQIKKYRRDKKIALFSKSNPQWRDLTPEVSRLYMGPSLRSGQIKCQSKE